MKITNKHGLPSVFVNMMKNDDYTKGTAQFSVTELISPPRIRILREKHDAAIEKDVADGLWALVGKAVHHVLETHAPDGTIPEQRLETIVDGVKVSGGIDLQVVNGNAVKIDDFKFTSTWAFKQDKLDWEQQLNLYAALCRANGRTPVELNITAILRDWSRAQAERDPTYPQAPVQRLAITMWPAKEADDFLKMRLHFHLDARYAADMGDRVAECTDEEKWMSTPLFAIVKKDGTSKRASKVFESDGEATNYVAMRPMYKIEKREAEPIRCKRDYCNVARFCDFGKKFHATGNQGEIGNDE